MTSLQKAIALLIFQISVMPSFADGLRNICLDEGWQFHYGDNNDASWRLVDLPHDWSIELDAASATGAHVGPFARHSQGGSATGNTVGGIGWYRKTFTLAKDDAEKQLSLYFEGVYNHAEVWLNGHKLYFNHYGYLPFRFDITPYVNRLGKPNVLTVRVSNEGLNTRWYAGSGIYRHVWLIRTPRLYADSWDTFIQTPKVSSDVATVDAATVIHNAGNNNVNARVEISIKDPQGHEVGRTQQLVLVQPGSLIPVHWVLPIAHPRLWSPDSPTRYYAVIRSIDTNTGHTDVLQMRFGIRSLSFSAKRGFLLNDSNVLLHGGCVHHDNGLLGAAAYNRAEDRKIQLLKNQGFNAVRCAHNMVSDHFLDACDSIGMMVIDEAFDQWLVAKNTDDYHQYFKEHSDSDLQTMVRRDRNHPSIILWSIGNEIPGRIEPDGLQAAERMRHTVKQLDTTRPVTAAICGWNQPSHHWADEDSLAFRSLDVGGYNYLYDKYEHDHGTHPDRVMFGAESYPKEAAQNWNMVERHPYVIGDFVWTAMDYLGEAGIGSASIRQSGKQSMFQDWPWYNGWCGDIDLIGRKKPQSYFRDVVWHRAPVTMAVEEYVPADSHQSVSAWGWQLEHQDWYSPVEGNLLRVNIYSRSPLVKLYLNDQFIGQKQPDNTYCASFEVPYRPGVLKAETATGETFVLQTPGKTVAIRLQTDRSVIAADGRDLSYVTIELVDANGRVVPDSNRQLTIAVSGDGKLAASGNASPTDQESFRSTTPRLYRGCALVILKSIRHRGQITLQVTSNGLPSQTTVVKTE